MTYIVLDHTHRLVGRASLGDENQPTIRLHGYGQWIFGPNGGNELFNDSGGKAWVGALIRAVSMVSLQIRC